MRNQGSTEYVIILSVIIIFALIIALAINSLGVFDLRNKLITNTNEINNLLRDVSVSYAINEAGLTQVALRSNVNYKVIIYNFTIGGCLINFNSTILQNDWITYSYNCSGIIGKAGYQYDLSCTLFYKDNNGIIHGDTGRCIGFYEKD